MHYFIKILLIKYILKKNIEYKIKILLEGNLYDATNMFQNCGNREIKFYKNFNDKRRRIFDKSGIINMKNMLSDINNLTIELSFFNSKNVENMGHMFCTSNINKLLNFSYLNTSSEKIYYICLNKQIMIHLIYLLSIQVKSSIWIICFIVQF